MLEQHTCVPAKIDTAVLAVKPSTHFTTQQHQNNREKHAVIRMSSLSSSPSVSSDDDSESNFAFPEDRSDDNGKGYFYDDSLGPVATEEEVAAYEESSAREREQLEQYRCLRTGETSVSTWYSLLL